jgi:hypothetical protein
MTRNNKVCNFHYLIPVLLLLVWVITTSYMLPQCGVNNVLLPFKQVTYKQKFILYIQL